MSLVIYFRNFRENLRNFLPLFWPLIRLSLGHDVSSVSNACIVAKHCVVRGSAMVQLNRAMATFSRLSIKSSHVFICSGLAAILNKMFLSATDITCAKLMCRVLVLILAFDITASP